MKKIGNQLLKKFAKVYDNYKTWRYNKIGAINSRLYCYVFAVCGKNLRIYGTPMIHHPELIYIGDDVSINEGVQINPNGKIYIGNNVTISSGAKIISNTLDTKDWTSLRLEKRIDHIGKSIHIGDGTWLCANSIVLPGVNIHGKGVIVAAGSVVTKDINEDFVLVGGVPARVISKIK